MTVAEADDVKKGSQLITRNSGRSSVGEECKLQRVDPSMKMTTWGMPPIFASDGTGDQSSPQKGTHIH
jgi:hypothetical protein